MNKLTVGSVSIALAAVLAAGHAEPVIAKGLSKKQVQSLIQKELKNAVKREVAKIPRVRGPRGEDGLRGIGGPPGPAGTAGPSGPAGRAGMDGFPSLFAYVDLDGRVDANRSIGITQDNLIEEVEVLEGAASPHPDGEPVTKITYCFVGLPPIIGGQVTLNGEAGYGAVVSPKLWINAEDGCPVRVAVHGYEQFPDDNHEPPISASFYVLLY